LEMRTWRRNTGQEIASVRVRMRSVSGTPRDLAGSSGAESLDPWAVTNILDSRRAQLRTSYWNKLAANANKGLYSRVTNAR
jgi:hypothetical protein